MKRSIADHLRKYVDVSPELEKVLSEMNLVKEYPKGFVLLKEGDLCNECFFVVEGLIRSYYLLENGEESSTDFFMEETVVSPSCYGTGEPSKHYLQCLEDTVVFAGNPQIEEEMYASYPELASMSRVIGEKIMAEHRDDFDSYKMGSPEERYLVLVESKPQLLQRVPQYQLASYLGMKPESLSRIRKRLSRR